MQSEDFMTADWFVFPPDVLRKISSRITNEVAGVNRVTYDISSKPPAVRLCAFPQIQVLTSSYRQWNGYDLFLDRLDIIYLCNDVVCHVVSQIDQDFASLLYEMQAVQKECRADGPMFASAAAEAK